MNSPSDGVEPSAKVFTTTHRPRPNSRVTRRHLASLHILDESGCGVYSSSQTVLNYVFTEYPSAGLLHP